MTIIKQFQKTVSVTEIDTDTFTRDQWMDFILSHVGPAMMAKILHDTNLSAPEKFERLKDKAIAAHQMAEEIAADFAIFMGKQ